MNPKDEIQKLIQAELKKWEDYDKKNENLRACQVVRFQSIRALLNELIASIEPEYIKATILEDRATIEVSNKNDSLSRMRWTIEPNFKKQEAQEEYWRFNLWQNKVNFAEAPGFKVEEKQGEDSNRTLEFGTEDEIIHYFAQEIAKRVAFYRYEKKRLA